MGWDAGRYPEKAAREVLKVLDNAIAKASTKAWSPRNSGSTMPALSRAEPSRVGCPGPWEEQPQNTQTVTIEMV